MKPEPNRAVKPEFEPSRVKLERSVVAKSEPKREVAVGGKSEQKPEACGKKEESTDTEPADSPGAGSDHEALPPEMRDCDPDHRRLPLGLKRNLYGQIVLDKARPIGDNYLRLDMVRFNEVSLPSARVRIAFLGTPSNGLSLQGLCYNSGSRSVKRDYSSRDGSTKSESHSAKREHSPRDGNAKSESRSAKREHSSRDGNAKSESRERGSGRRDGDQTQGPSSSSSAMKLEYPTIGTLKSCDLLFSVHARVLLRTYARQGLGGPRLRRFFYSHQSLRRWIGTSEYGTILASWLIVVLRVRTSVCTSVVDAAAC